MLKSDAIAFLESSLIPSFWFSPLHLKRAFKDTHIRVMRDWGLSRHNKQDREVVQILYTESTEDLPQLKHLDYSNRIVYQLFYD